MNLTVAAETGQSFQLARSLVAVAPNIASATATIQTQPITRCGVPEGK